MFAVWSFVSVLVAVNMKSISNWFMSSIVGLIFRNSLTSIVSEGSIMTPCVSTLVEFW